MLKKFAIFILVGLFLVGCNSNTNKNSTPKAEKDSSEVLTEAFSTAKKLTNFTKNEQVLITISNDEIETVIETISEIKINKNEDKKEGYSKISTNVSGIGENSAEIWVDDTSAYIKSEEGKEAIEMDFDLFYQAYTNIGYDSLINNELLKSAKFKSKNNKSVYTIALNLEEVSQIISDQMGISGDLKFEPKNSSVEFVVDKNNYLESMKMIIESSVTENDVVFNYVIDLSVEYSNINTTSIDYPSDLDKYLVVEKNVDQNEELLKNTLVEEYDYQENDNVYSYSFGTETYQFDFNQKVFTIKAQSGEFTYHWVKNEGTIESSGCTYSFDSSKSSSCTDEEVENLKLAKEVFIQELAYASFEINDILEN